MKRLCARSTRLTPGRKQTGSVLLLIIACVAVIVAVLLAYCAFSGIFFNRGVIQNKTESLALETALKLNEQDNAGRVNLLTAHSRELVYDSRQLRNKVTAQMPELTSLADSLLSESREGSKVMEKERELLGGHIVTELSNVSKKFSKNEHTGAGGIPFIGGNISNPGVLNLEVGDIEGMPSNVEVSVANQSLAQYDAQMGYVKSLNDLYPAHINLKLPNEDADLNFELSALPSRQNTTGTRLVLDPNSVLATTAPPASLHSPRAFRRSTYLLKDGKALNVSGIKVPSAVRCAVAAQVQTDKGAGGKLMVDTTAATNGTNPEQ
jgi:hypothetical protein